jgi:integrase
MRDRGTGSIFRQAGTTRWTIQYYVNGRRVREKSGTDDRQAAQQKLTQRLSQADKGEPIVPSRRKPLLVCELYERLERKYIRDGHCSLRSLKLRWTHLKPVFGNLMAASIDKDKIEQYTDARLAEEAARATINRETAALKSMFRVAADKLPKLPIFPPPIPEKNVREGFVEDADYAALVANASELWLRTFLEIAYTFGWRRSEILGLRVRHVAQFVDGRPVLQRTVRLDPDTTKNLEGRECPMSPKMSQLLKKCIEGKAKDDFVLTRSGNRAIKDFRCAWESLCTKSNLPGLLVHDLRRSAARQLRSAGVAESVIMKIGGWKTAQVFRRYAIVGNRDTTIAMEQLGKQRIENEREIEEAKAENGHNFSHSLPSEAEPDTTANEERIN